MTRKLDENKMLEKLLFDKRNLERQIDEYCSEVEELPDEDDHSDLRLYYKEVVAQKRDQLCKLDVYISKLQSVISRTDEVLEEIAGHSDSLCSATNSNITYNLK